MGCASSQPVAPEPKTRARRGVHAGVQLGWLKRFVKQVPPGMSTEDVVLKIIKPKTKARLCRYVSLAEEEAPGAVDAEIGGMRMQLDALRGIGPHGDA